MFVTNYHDETFCCGSSHSAMVCASNELGLVQMIIVVLCAHCLTATTYYYFDHEAKYFPEPGRDWHLAKLMLGALVVANVASIAGAVVAGMVGGMNLTKAEQGDGGRLINQYSTGLMITSSLVTTLHWIPQIRETWKLQRLGSLSLLTLLLQSGGSVLTAYNLIGTSDFASQWYIPTPYLVGAFMMFIVIAVAGYFSLLRRWRLQLLRQLRGSGESDTVSPLVASSSTDDDEEEHLLIFS